MPTSRAPLIHSTIKVTVTDVPAAIDLRDRERSRFGSLTSYVLHSGKRSNSIPNYVIVAPVHSLLETEGQRLPIQVSVGNLTQVILRTGLAEPITLSIEKFWVNRNILTRCLFVTFW